MEPPIVTDVQYAHLDYQLSELAHEYGERVHILSDPYLMTHLVRLCAPQTVQPEICELVTVIYQNLVKIVINLEFPRRAVAVPTRMIEATPRGVYRGECIEPDARTVVVNIARAGTLPSQVCYSAFNYILNPRFVRQDHIIMERTTDERSKVTGAAARGQKIGGPVEDAIVVFPDPMGATGSSIRRALDLYGQVGGKARKYIAMHLIVTPEYVRAVHAAHPELVIYAVRLDRGLSAPEVLSTVPGRRWAEEKGLTDKQYIVPGGGGFGEILNNTAT